MPIKAFGFRQRIRRRSLAKQRRYRQKQHSEYTHVHETTNLLHYKRLSPVENLIGYVCLVTST
jgi:hypothetical protein